MKLTLLENLKLIYNSLYRNESEGGEEMMRENEFVITGIWPVNTSVKSLGITPQVAEPLIAEFFEKLIAKAQNKQPLENATYVLGGTTHEVRLKATA